jgi:adenine-specific DNA-methyltransferase
MTQTQLDMWETESPEFKSEDPDFLTKQLITYIGNKRSLLDFIGNGVDIVRKRLDKKRITSFDVFSGSGVVSRYLKRYSDKIITNDLEKYSATINRCYLTNASSVDSSEMNYWLSFLKNNLVDSNLKGGFIRELYAPQDINNIALGERCFYTPRNAMFIDTARQLIENIPEKIKPYFIKNKKQ